MLTRVVKIGGNELDAPEWVSACARALAGAGPLVVVHGGGRAVTALSRKLGLPVEKKDGLRVTTPEVAEVVEMVVAGPVNRVLVAALRQAGVDAIGLAGVDGGVLSARPLPGGFGHVGEIVEVRAALLESLLLAGFVPVLAPTAPGADLSAVPFNVNADDAAAAVAAALGADELLFVSDVPGVQVNGVAQPALSAADAEQLIADGVASNGMAAKLRAAARALEGGARSVRIGDLSLLADPAAGTRILSRATQVA